MSSTTWTPAALSSEARLLAGRCWRLVEAQHIVATMKLVDTVDEQARLEELIEGSKPAIPPECRHLHYLLATPFRYGSPYPHGSRFRRAGLTRGVYYAAEAQETAIAEMAFYRLLFFAESPATPWPANPAEFTAFAADYRTQAGLDLTLPPLDRDAGLWADRTDYAACQALAEAARAAALDVIRYRSVRDPRGGANVALLECRVFLSAEPVATETWRILAGAAGIQAIRDFPRTRLGFDRATFAADPRIGALRWER